jgi:hypothetical protein
MKKYIVSENERKVRALSRLVAMRGGATPPEVKREGDVFVAEVEPADSLSDSLKRQCLTKAQKDKAVKVA